MKSTQKKFKTLLTKHCAGLRIIVGVWASIYRKRVEVSIHAKGDRKSRRMVKLRKRLERMERELIKAFSWRKVDIRICPNSKPSEKRKGKPFRGKDIIFVTVPPIRIKP